VTEVLAATGYVLDQTPQLDDIELGRRRARADLAGNPPPLGPYRTFQVPVRDIAELAGVQIDTLVAADRLAPVLAAALPGDAGSGASGGGASGSAASGSAASSGTPHPSGWKLLSAPEEVEL
jgi:hypothetical protein